MLLLFYSPYQYEVSVSSGGFCYDFISGGAAVMVDASVAEVILNNPMFSMA